MPLVNKTFNQLIDFTRTSSATYVDSAGKIVPTAASRNLLTFTQEFDNAVWAKTGVAAYPFDPALATYGPERVTNGDFSGGSTGWTLGTGWAVAAGIATKTAGVASALTSSASLSVGRVYAVTYTISGMTAGNAFGTLTGGAQVNGAARTVNGTYTDYIVAVSGNNAAGVTANASFDGSIDNISVREVIGGLITAPDGTLTADSLITVSTTAPGAYYNFTSSAAAYTFSVYVKQVNTEFSEIAIIDQGTANNRVRLTYATGVVTVVSGSAVGAADNVGNGWWRFSVTTTLPASGTDTVTVYPGSPAGVVGDRAYVWGAQLELGSTATSYARNFGGLFPPRFDYDPVTLAPRGLLVEEQRTNLLLRSEEFDNSGAWVPQRATVTANAATAPDGTSTADKLVEDTTASSMHFVPQIATASSSTTYTYSVLLKAAERTRASLQDGGGSSAIGDFDLSNGTVISAYGATATITNFGNGWYRCSITFTTGAAQTRVNARIFLVDTGTNTTYTGDGTSGLYIWGAQLEAGSFATSYIPTVASQVTRTADVATITGANFSQWYNQSEGTFVVEASQTAATGVISRAITVSDGTNSETIQVAAGYSTEGYAEIRDGLALQMSAFNGVIAPRNVFRIALAVKANDCAISTNGAAPTVDTSVTMPTVNIANIGTGVAASSAINGHIRSIRYYPTRLTNTQLQALTA